MSDRQTPMGLRATTDRAGLARMDAGQIREAFVIGDLFRPGEIQTTYIEVERAVVGSAAPLESPWPCRPTGC
jgi:4-deoxy-L-threo-5-hexosulose-uronate ketol-isomerase